MGEVPSILEALNERGHGVRVEFFWTNDRYSHQIIGVRGSQSHALLESHEGGSEDQLPPSPCLTQLHRQEETIFLTGATSIGHWSMSVQVAELSLETEFSDEKVDALPKCKALTFEVACRIKRECQDLRSTYKTLVDVTSGVVGSGRLAFAGLPNHKPAYGVMFNSPNTIQSDETKSLIFTPSFQLTNSYPYTIQWKYSVGWVLR